MRAGEDSRQLCATPLPLPAPSGSCVRLWTGRDAGALRSRRKTRRHLAPNRSTRQPHAVHNTQQLVVKGGSCRAKPCSAQANLLLPNV